MMCWTSGMHWRHVINVVTVEAPFAPVAPV